MLTGEIRSQIDRIWDAFWTGGISNPLEVIEQITYLLFLKRLDDLHTLGENKAARLKAPIERRIFPKGADPATNPKGWAVASLGDLCSGVIDCPHSTPIYSTEWSSQDLVDAPSAS